MKKRRLAASSFVYVLYFIFFTARISWGKSVTIYVMINYSCVTRLNVWYFMTNISMAYCFTWAFIYWWAYYSWHSFPYHVHSHVTRTTIHSISHIHICSACNFSIKIAFCLHCFKITIIIYFHKKYTFLSSVFYVYLFLLLGY